MEDFTVSEEAQCKCGGYRSADGKPPDGLPPQGPEVKKCIGKAVAIELRMLCTENHEEGKVLAVLKNLTARRVLVNVLGLATYLRPMDVDAENPCLPFPIVEIQHVVPVIVEDNGDRGNLYQGGVLPPVQTDLVGIFELPLCEYSSTTLVHGIVEPKSARVCRCPEHMVVPVDRITLVKDMDFIVKAVGL